MENYRDDLEAVLQNAHSHGVKAVVTIGIDVSSSKTAVKLAAKYPTVKATVGVHPHDVSNITTEDLDELSSLIDRRSDYIVAYGEIGLDYVKQYSPRDAQLRALNDQLSLAKSHKLPVVIHDREAHEDILKLLKKNGPFDQGGIMHCFSGDLDYAKEVLDLGFHISIPGIVTFKNAKDLKQVAAEIPLDKLLLETDGPFLAPVPYRGKRNEPLYVLYTAEEIASLRDITLEEVAAATTANALNVFSFSLYNE